MEQSPLADQLINYLGGKKNSETVASTNTILWVIVKEVARVESEELRSLNEVNGIVTNETMIQLTLNQAAKPVVDSIITEISVQMNEKVIDEQDQTAEKNKSIGTKVINAIAGIN